MRAGETSRSQLIITIASDTYNVLATTTAELIIQAPQVAAHARKPETKKEEGDGRVEHEELKREAISSALPAAARADEEAGELAEDQKAEEVEKLAAARRAEEEQRTVQAETARKAEEAERLAERKRTEEALAEQVRWRQRLTMADGFRTSVESAAERARKFANARCNRAHAVAKFRNCAPLAWSLR